MKFSRLLEQPLGGPKREKRKFPFVPFVFVLCLSCVTCLSISSESLLENLIGPTGKDHKQKVFQDCGFCGLWWDVRGKGEEPGRMGE
jgi:hypothetical protein